MAKNYVCRGVTMDYKNGGSAVIMAGSVVPLPGMIGVAETDIPPGKVGALLTEGVVRLPKASADTFAQGMAVAWDAETGKVAAVTATDSTPKQQGQEGETGGTSTPASNPPAGIVWADAGSGTTAVQVKLNV